MALPALGVVARFIVSQGRRQAIKKYGQKKTDKAAEEIQKREDAITKKTHWQKGNKRGPISDASKAFMRTDKPSVRQGTGMNRAHRPKGSTSFATGGLIKNSMQTAKPN